MSSIDSPPANLFLPYQLQWIEDDSPLRIAEKSVRIGWTYCDAFKNVRKRLHHPRRDYLFSSKDQGTAIEYVTTCYQFCELYDRTKSILSHGIENEKFPIFKDGKNTGFTEEMKFGYIKFDNGSRIVSFSSNPHALRAFGGDVGLDEFAFHHDPETLWSTASGRITWGFDLALWSSHNGPDTLFYSFCRDAAGSPTPEGSLSRAASEDSNHGSLSPAATEENPQSAIRDPQLDNPKSVWSYYRVTLRDAIRAGLVEKINEIRGTNLTREQFVQNCRARSRLPEVFEQEYMCNPSGGTQGLVPYSAIQRCMLDYEIERVHLEESQVLELFGEYQAHNHNDREIRIRHFIESAFTKVAQNKLAQYRLGFDVAASGRGNLTVIYLDRLEGQTFTLVALFTCRTEDWHFIKSVLFTFMGLRSCHACGDQTGLGRQICWEASQQFSGRFRAVNFSSEKSDIGFKLMHQLAAGEKRFPIATEHRDIACDYLALRKHNTGSRWIFTEGANNLNPNSHCDIAWAGGLASHAQSNFRDVGAAVVYDHWDSARLWKPWRPGMPL